MSLNPLTLLEKAISEHGSASILKERLTAVKDELAKVTKERDDIKKKFDDLEVEIRDLRAKVEDYKKKDGFTEYRGALFKRKATGGYEPAVFCPICTHAMSSLQGILPYSCARDKQKVDFNGEALAGILAELEKK